MTKSASAAAPPCPHTHWQLAVICVQETVANSCAAESLCFTYPESWISCHFCQTSTYKRFTWHCAVTQTAGLIKRFAKSLSSGSDSRILKWLQSLFCSVISICIWVARVNMLFQVSHVGHGLQAEGASECKLHWTWLAHTMHTPHVTPQMVLATDDHVADLTGEALSIGHMDQLVAP